MRKHCENVEGPKNSPTTSRSMFLYFMRTTLLHGDRRHKRMGARTMETERGKDMTTLTIRIPKELKKALTRKAQEVAKETGVPVSFSTYIRIVLEGALRRDTIK